MLKKFFLNLLLIIIISSLVNIIFYKKIILNKNNNDQEFCEQDNQNLIFKENCNQEYSLRKEYEDWNTYKNNEYCYSLQYPTDWEIFESLDHIGPYVALSDDKNDLNKNSKIMIESVGMSFLHNFFSNKLIDLTSNATVENYWETVPASALRISGEVEGNVDESVNPCSYMDLLIIPQEELGLYVIISYCEKGHDEKDREIVNKIFESFNIAKYYE